MKMQRRAARFAWATLAYNLAVIAWGAYVRATGSGAGCGSHWPLCNGEVVPRAPSLETLIEFSHRLTSGLALVAVVVMVWFAHRAFPKGHLARKGAWASLVVIIVEALLGAGLVIFGLVADDDSMARAVVMGLHLANTLILLGVLTLAAWWASPSGRPLDLRAHPLFTGLFGVGLLAMLVLGVSGAITALGDTLFPAGSLREGIAQDFSPTAHLLLRLRIFHPLIAMATGAYLLVLAGLAVFAAPRRSVRIWAALLVGLFLLQIGVGFVNLVLLAPVWLQLVHLLVADLVWIALILLTAHTLAVPAPSREGEAWEGIEAGHTTPAT